MWLQTLQSMLEEFSLVELEPLWDASVSCRGYGVGPETMRVGDVVIPLWNLEDYKSQSALCMSSSQGDMQLSTMLAVRCTGDQRSVVAGEERWVPVGRIIGPVTCITWTEETIGSWEASANEHGGVVNQTRWPLIRII